ncbi:regulatory protein, arsR family [Paraoerskovia marina]|uniref:Regulatory protein, arsR family n=1 Tax=Paraoerskovia marina TaxID=545619 RepID=A0A1H1MD01_9CELL|nr:metalloregulator ArsR/SmtB family transcription factor [Paraoerskovia marina]SDR84721.1 regulatory protein, arsR family [Paraoerskovia marina]
MTMNAAVVADAEPGTVAALFRALGEPARLTIVRHLFTGEHRVRDLTDHLGLAQSTVSAHLSCLRECGLVVVRAEGRSSLYRLADPAGLRGLLAAAEDALATTGAAVARCPSVPEPRAAS